LTVEVDTPSAARLEDVLPVVPQFGDRLADVVERPVGLEAPSESPDPETRSSFPTPPAARSSHGAGALSCRHRPGVESKENPQNGPK